MAKSPQEEDTALGAELIRNDKWLNWTILRSDEWATGTREGLLSGEAWRRFCERLWALDDRIRNAAVPGDDATRADGFRHVAMLVRNAFDVALEDLDARMPTVRWADRRNKIGWDCPDALYATIPVRDDAVYRLRGRRGNVHFMGLQVAAGIQTLANAHADEWDLDADGRFELVVGGPERPRNWIPLAPGACWIFVRQFFYDWTREDPSPLLVDRLDDGPRGERSGVLDPAFFARRLDAAASHVEASLDLWTGTVAAIRERYTNAFPAQAFGGTAMGAQQHQSAGTCWYRVLPEEALVVEVPVPRAKYWSIDLCNYWLESLDYASHQSSLNGHQAHVDPDGVFRAVVTHDDPGVPNWLDPVGHPEGSMIYRWNLAETTPIPHMRIVPRAALRSHLHPDTPATTPAERARVIAGRQEGVRRRFARPIW